MTLLTDVLAKLQIWTLIFTTATDTLAQHSSYSDHPRIVAKIERGLPDDILSVPNSGFLYEHAGSMRTAKEIRRLYQAW